MRPVPVMNVDRDDLEWPRWLLAVGPLVGVGNQLVYNAVLPYSALEGGFERMVSQILANMLWVPLTPFVVRLAQRLPLDGASRLRNLLLHCGAALSAFAVMYVAYYGLRRGFHAVTGWGPYTWQRIVRRLASGGWLVDGLIFWTIAGVIHARRWGDELTRRARKMGALETRLARTQLEALKAQLNPHFLFNTLNAIAALVRRDPETAERMIGRLSGFMRKVLESGDVTLVPLSRELEDLRAYVEIQRMRFRDSLVFEVDAPPELLAEPVPHLLLQPLVENAIEHGGRPRRILKVTVAARKVAPDRLLLIVDDDGRGLDAGGGARPGGLGVGLVTTRARMQTLYGARAELRLEPRPGGGTRAWLSLPAQAAMTPRPAAGIALATRQAS